MESRGSVLDRIGACEHPTAEAPFMRENAPLPHGQRGVCSAG
jgi:hypothetical protein